MNGNELAVILREIHGAYGTEITEDMANLWGNTFHNDDAERVSAGLTEWINTEQRTPTPAGIREKMRTIVRRQISIEAPPPANAVPFSVGIQIAYEKYCQVKKKNNEQPPSFAEWRKRIPVHDQ